MMLSFRYLGDIHGDTQQVMGPSSQGAPNRSQALV